jgi:hypothetical protein
VRFFPLHVSPSIISFPFFFVLQIIKHTYLYIETLKDGIKLVLKKHGGPTRMERAAGGPATQDLGQASDGMSIFGAERGEERE